MIDFCVAINGINLDCFVPLFFETLFRKVSLTQLHIHVIEKNIEDKIHKYIEQKKNMSPVPFDIYQLNEPLAEETGPSRNPIVWMGGDTALTCKWMMKNCGVNDWAIISHFDMAFNNDFMTPLLSKMAPDTGMIGAHNQGLVAINRIAYNQCFVGFQSMSGFFVSTNEQGDYKLRFGDDPRCRDKSIRIEGFDVAEMLELNMQFRTWRVTPFPEFNRVHIAAGSGYHNNDGIAASQRNRALNLLKRERLTPIGG